MIGNIHEQFDNIIVGAGAAGAVAARQLADRGRRVLVLEQRGHIAGNCYDRFDENGILIHQYGPHIFHTKEKEIFDYLSQFTLWYEYSHEVMAKIKDELLPIPFNFNTLNHIFDKKKADKIENKLTSLFGMGEKVPILKLKEQKDKDIREIAEYVYQNIFLQYTMKQWGKSPEEIDPEVTGRVPVVLSYDNRYFQDTWQGMPEKGYTHMFSRILDHSGITVMLNRNAGKELEFSQGKILFQGKRFRGDVIYTGPLDELFSCCFGKLPYRSLIFQFEHYQKEFYQPCGVVNYTTSEKYTRITEFKYLTGQKNKGTTIVKEFPIAYEGKNGQVPYYSINNEKNMKLYNKYMEKAKEIQGFYPLGRLAEYKYYNIDQMVKRSIELVKKLLNG